MIRIGLKLLIVLAILVIAGLVFVVAPASKTFALRASLREKTDLIERSTALLEEFKDPAGEWKAWEDRLKNLDQRFPGPQAITFVMQQLGDKSKELGLEILAQHPVVEETPPTPENAQPSPFEKKKILLELECGYEALGKYLAALGTLPTFFSVEALDVVSNLDALPDLNVRLVLAFYITRKTES